MEEEIKTGEELEVEEAEEVEEQEEEKPFWLQEEEPDSSEDDEGDEPNQAVPVATHVKVKQKLKAKLKDADDELAQLRKKVEQLEQDKPAVQAEPPKRPRRSEFDDEDEYDDAMEKYDNERREFDAQYVAQNSQQTQQLQKRQQQIEQAVDSHYTRAEEVVQKYGIKPEIYQKADATVKEIIQHSLPNYNAESVFSGMVEVLGEGSEVAMFHIGRNKQAASDFARALQEDPTGLKASVFLGRIAEKVGNAKPNRNSQAPSPAAKLKGDEASSIKGGTAHKKWADAHKKGKTQEAYNIKQAAKKQGVDVSTWR